MYIKLDMINVVRIVSCKVSIVAKILDILGENG